MLSDLLASRGMESVLTLVADQWPGIVHMPEYKTYLSTGPYPTTNPLPTWYASRSNSAMGYDLLCRLFEWDPAKRITARECLQHAWFQEEGGVAAT